MTVNTSLIQGTYLAFCAVSCAKIEIAPGDGSLPCLSLCPDRPSDGKRCLPQPMQLQVSLSSAQNLP